MVEGRTRNGVREQVEAVERVRSGRVEGPGVAGELRRVQRCQAEDGIGEYAGGDGEGTDVVGAEVHVSRGRGEEELPDRGGSRESAEQGGGRKLEVGDLIGVADSGGQAVGADGKGGRRAGRGSTVSLPVTGSNR